MSALEQSYNDGVVVVALLGHNQAINRGERGAIAWLEAIQRRGWDFSIAQETLDLVECESKSIWAEHKSRLFMENGHLHHSLRFYRNKELESWVHHVLEDDVTQAKSVAAVLATEGHQVFLTRDIETARNWVRSKRIGHERSGIVASAQARRLEAEGLFVKYKPEIHHWMLSPTGDIRSSNMLETVQNQFQIQGLELDYTIVCWDADLRREKEAWSSWKISGAKWNKDNALDIAKNSYRVLLTRARKGMVIFIPKGDLSGNDSTRQVEYYDNIFDHLVLCGGQFLPDG